MQTTIKLAQKLINLPSISPNDNGCQKIIIKKLQSLKFNVEPMPCNNTMNLWAYRGQGRTLTLAGHTDIVPPGNLHDWKFHPFKGTIHNNILYGRGASDMKGALAAMLTASERFITQHPNHQGRLAFLITSDEESKGTYGTKKIIETLMNRQEKIDYCLIGEPSSQEKIGDTIKNGRRGSLTATIKIYGTQGHVAYLQTTDNPIHLAISNLNKLLTTQWDSKINNFPQTTMQITKIHSGICSNMIPPHLTAECNFRFNNLSTKDNIQKKVNEIMSQYNNLTYKIRWSLSAQPYLSPPGKLISAAINSIKHYQKIMPIIDTGGGTSDGRFIAHTGAEIAELGAINKTIHKINECINIHDLEILSKIYQKVIHNILL